MLFRNSETSTLTHLAWDSRFYYVAHVYMHPATFLTHVLVISNGCGEGVVRMGIRSFWEAQCSEAAIKQTIDGTRSIYEQTNSKYIKKNF